MEQAVLSLLAGDVFTQSRARLPLFFFKVAYYLTYMFNWKQNRAAARRRREGLQTAVTNLKDYAVNHET
jgi:hypothetical protein